MPFRVIRIANDSTRRVGKVIYLLLNLTTSIELFAMFMNSLYIRHVCVSLLMSMCTYTLL